MDVSGAAIDGTAERAGFSGVVRIERLGEPVLERAYGFADRRHGIANTLSTRFAIASGTKGLTALAVVSLIEEGALSLDTPAREVLGGDLPLIAADVTVEHLLAHRSGIGDYLDEDAQADRNDHVMTVPVHLLETTEGFVEALDGYPTVFAAGSDFAYCNGGYIVLALIAERAGGVPYHDLVQARVCDPAGMRQTAFLRSDELPGDAALGYLHPEGLRTNVLHLPVRGNGDGGIYTTAADIDRFWGAFYGGKIVSQGWVDEMVRPRSVDPRDGSRYGLGFWLHASLEAAMLEGSDAGVSFRTFHDPAERFTYTVIGNTTEGAWPVVELLDGKLDA